jgi:hypothetical protein
MPRFQRRLLGLCIPPAALATLDGALTLAGQSAEYWAGNYARVNEMSPTFNHLLTYHPLAFAAGWLGWILIFCGMILLLPQTLALTTSIAVTVGHTLGATTWLLYRYHYGYQVCGYLHIAMALALAVGIRWGWGAEPCSDAPAGARLPLVLRWAAIALLFAIAVYLFLWPREP